VSLNNLPKKYPSLKKDMLALSNELLQNPRLGTSLGSECYKIRMAVSTKGRGKSSGARVITYLKIRDEIIFLMAIYDKSEMANISEKDLKDRLKDSR